MKKMKEETLSAFRNRLIQIGLGVAAAGVLVGWTTVYSGDATQAPFPASSIVRAAQTAPQKWIYVGPEAANARPGPVVPPAALEPPREVPNGPGSKTVTGYLEKIIPDGSTLKTATDYPDLQAAAASYTTPDGNLITLAVQRMSRPLS